MYPRARKGLNNGAAIRLKVQQSPRACPLHAMPYKRGNPSYLNQFVAFALGVVAETVYGWPYYTALTSTLDALQSSQYLLFVDQDIALGSRTQRFSFPLSPSIPFRANAFDAARRRTDVMGRAMQPRYIS